MHANSIIFLRKKDLRVQHFPQCDVKYKAGISMWLKLYIIYITGRRSGRQAYICYSQQAGSRRSNRGLENSSLQIVI